MAVIGGERLDTVGKDLAVIGSRRGGIAKTFLDGRRRRAGNFGWTGHPRWRNWGGCCKEDSTDGFLRIENTVSDTDGVSGLGRQARVACQKVTQSTDWIRDLVRDRIGEERGTFDTFLEGLSWT